VSVRIRVYKDAEALWRGAARLFAEISLQCIREQGSCSLALSGGKTPRWLYGLLARLPYLRSIPWERVRVFWGDERFVPHSHEASNFRMAWETLLSKVPVLESNLFPVPTDAAGAEAAARAYEATLRSVFALRDPVPPSLDLLLLGLGADGHTASLFPGGPECDERMWWCVASRAPEETPASQRVTLTLPVINRARNVLFLVSGREKEAVLRKILSPDRSGAPQYPAQRVAPAGELWWLTDIPV